MMTMINAISRKRLFALTKAAFLNVSKSFDYLVFHFLKKGDDKMDLKMFFILSSSLLQPQSFSPPALGRGCIKGPRSPANQHSAFRAKPSVANFCTKRPE